MRKLLLLSIVISLVICVAGCSGSTHPPNVDAGVNSSNAAESEYEARGLVQTWLDDHPFDETVTIGDSLTAEDNSGFVFTLYQNGELAQIRVVKSSGALLRHNPENNQNISINDWYKNFENNTAAANIDESVTTPEQTPATSPTPALPEQTLPVAPSEILPTETTDAYGEADSEAYGQGGAYEDGYYDSTAEWYEDGYYNDLESTSIIGNFVTYANDGFSLLVPSNTKISSQVEQESANQFSISEGAGIATEKIYELQFIYGVADVNVQINIFPSDSAYFSTTNITVPNTDGAYLYESISDSIIETSKYELKVIRGNLVYILETTYNPSVALMGQAKGQSDFSYERELLKELLSTFETMIYSFSLTNSPVSFESIANSGTYWQENVTDLMR